MNIAEEAKSVRSAIVPVHHAFRRRDPGGPPLGLGRMSARDQWRYERSLSRFKARYGKPIPLFVGELGSIFRFRIVPVESETAAGNIEHEARAK